MGAEALVLEKFLQLHVSLSGVFVLNYLSSLLSLSLIVFVPMMLGLGLGLLFSRGPAMLLLFPLVAGFLLMRSEEHTSELQSHLNLVCRLLLEKKKRI